MAIAQLLVVRIASLMLRRELILQIRIPHVFVNVVALSTHSSFHSSSEPAIDNSKHLPFSVPTHTHVLGATPIKAPFDHCIIFFILIRSASPALELFFRGVVYIRNYTVISKCEMQKVPINGSWFMQKFSAIQYGMVYSPQPFPLAVVPNTWKQAYKPLCIHFMIVAEIFFEKRNIAMVLEAGCISE